MTTEPRPGGSAQRVPCATCASAVDALRAPFVAHLAGAFRYYCSRECFDQRPRTAVIAPRLEASSGRGDGATAPSLEQVADMLGLARASLPHDLRADTALLQDGVGAAWRRRPRPGVPETEDTVSPAVAVALALLGLALRALSELPAAVRAPLTLVVVVAGFGVAVRDIVRARAFASSWLPWLAGLVAPVGVVVVALRAASDLSSSRDLALAPVLLAPVSVAAWATRAALARARAALGTLAKGLPSTARVSRSGVEEIIAVEQVRAGEEVIVGEGESVPVDGVLRSAQALVIPFPGGVEACVRVAGDSVLAGATVVEGTLRVLATRAGDDVSIARLLRAIEPGSELPRTVGIAGRAAQLCLVAAGALAGAGAVVHARSGQAEAALVALVAFAAAPAAIAAALAQVPFASAITRAAIRGIIFRDEKSVEAAAAVGTVVLCVSGTVTSGRLEVVDVVSLGTRSERELIGLVLAAEEVVRDHPIARAFARLGAARAAPRESVRRPTLLAGRGITAISVGGETMAVGSRQLLLAEGVSVAPAEDVARAVEGQQRSAVFVALAGRVEGVFGLEDPLRDEARPAVQALMDAGFDLALLGGESAGTLESVGLALDVVNVRPEVLPEDRAAAVRSIAEVAISVAVVGHPQRDGVALGAADVAVSLSAAGAAGGETAIALARDDLADAAAALRFARNARDRARSAVVATCVCCLLGVGACSFVPAAGPLGALVAALTTIAVGSVAVRD